MFRYSYAVIVLILICNHNFIHATVIMIDPAGHAKNTGRRLYQNYERAETYNCALALKTIIETRFQNTHVVLTRSLGDDIVSLQNASFANRLNVDFFLNINFCREHGDKTHFYFYHLVFDPILDFAKRSIAPYSFIPINQAHYANIQRSRDVGEKIRKNLTAASYQKNFECHELYGLPIKPLVGINAPAVSIECTLLADDQWQQFMESLVESIHSALNLNPV